jgi:hypothetical protein
MEKVKTKTSHEKIMESLKLHIDTVTGREEIEERAARNVAEAFWASAGSYNVGKSSGGGRGPGGGHLVNSTLLQAYRDRQGAK